MVQLQLVTASGLPAPGGHYSHAVVAGGLAFISGLLPVDSAGKALADEPFEVQMAQVLHNLDAVLTSWEAAAVSWCRFGFIYGRKPWGPFNALYAAWMGEHRPARCVVPVPALHFGVALEVEAVAQVSV